MVWFLGHGRMALDEIQNFVLLLPNREWHDLDSSDYQSSLVTRLQSNISYDQNIKTNLRTLSSSNADLDGTINGFLYVPDLNVDDPCFNSSKEYVPANVTRQANLPPADFNLIAIAPWFSVNCTQSYLAAARQDPIRAFLFYLPDNRTDQPPHRRSAAWALHDGGRWKSTNQFPVYAVSGSVGNRMMYESNLYSKNMTEVPFGHDISEAPGVDSRDYVRIYTQLHVSTRASLPGIWVLLLIIVVVFAAMVLSTSILMHIVSKFRRKSLRRRVQQGEVDLEALGIKRLTVPQSIIEQMPTFMYACADSPSPGMKKSRTAVLITQHPFMEAFEGTSGTSSQLKSEPLPPENPFSSIDSKPSHKFLFEQPTCPICLDDFEFGLTLVRELPCRHLFHPDCIDPFLEQVSSLCPICKKSALPRGICPTKITNEMVNRERNVRKLRSRIVIHDEEALPNVTGMKSRIRRLGANLERAMFKIPIASRNDSASNEIQLSNTLAVVNVVPVPIPLSAEENADNHEITRQARAQQRIRDFAARQPHLLEAGERATNPRSKWQRVWSKAFPVFA